MYVVKKVAGTVKHDLIAFNNEDQAIGFCEERDGVFLDENCFEWHLEVDEKSGDTDEFYMRSMPCTMNDCDDEEWKHYWGTEDYDPYDPFEE